MANSEPLNSPSNLKAQFYSSIANAPSSTPNSAFYNNDFGVSAQEIDGMQRVNPYSAPSSGGGGGSTGGGSVAPVVNPLAAKFDADLPSLLASIRGGEAASTGNASAGLNTNIVDLATQLQKEQSAIDQQNIQNEASRQQGTAGVLSMIQHGLQSGGITLANKGASTSSAAEALARAYSDIGRRAQTQVGQQYAQGQNAANVAQQNEQLDLSSGVTKFNLAKQQAINGIVQDAQNQLRALESQRLYSGSANPIDIEGQKQQIQNSATSALAQLDQQLASQTGGIHALGQQEASGKAAEMLQNGTAPANQFSYTTAGPLQVQNSGPVASQLPIFTNPSKKTT